VYDGFGLEKDVTFHPGHPVVKHSFLVKNNNPFLEVSREQLD